MTPSSNPLTGPKLLFATLSVGIGTLLITLDMFIANVSIPTIAGELGVSQDNGTWVITSYTVANAITIPLTGWLTTYFGRVRLFCISMILFSIMSFFCGLSSSFMMLLVFRVLQGGVSGSLIPLSQAILLAMYPTKKGFAIGLWGLLIMVGPGIGPVIGGWITYQYDWRWIFYINVPIGIFAGGVSLVLLSSYETVRKKLSVDTIGLLLLVITVSSFQIMLDRGNDDDWWRSHFIVSLSILAFVGLCFFVVWETFHPTPVVDLSFFTSRNFTVGSIIIGLSGFLVMGSLVVSPIWVQAELGYTPLWAGYSIALFGVGGLIFFPLVGQYLSLLDVRVWIALGCLLLVPSFFYMAYLNIWSPFFNLSFPRLFQGIGFAFLYVPLITISLAGIPEKKMASAAGVFSFIRMLFISSGVSLSTTRFMRRENFFQSRYVESVIPSNPQLEPYLQTLSTHLGLTGKHADAFVYKMVQNQAFTETFLEICWLTAWGFIFLFILVFLFRSPHAALERAKRIAAQEEREHIS